MRVLNSIVPLIAALAHVGVVAGAESSQDLKTGQPAQGPPLASKGPKVSPVVTEQPRSARTAQASSIVSSLKSSKAAAEGKKTSSTTTVKVVPKTTSKAAAKTTAKTTSKKVTTTSAKKVIKVVTTTKKTTTPAKKAATTTKKPKLLKVRQAKTSTTATAVCTQAWANPLSYTPSPNTPIGFLNDPQIQANSSSWTIPPAGYSTAFINTLGEVRAVDGLKYIGVWQVGQYNTSLCSVMCDRNPDCSAFNIYYERQGLTQPVVGVCANPEARAAAVCTFWGNNLDVTMATNYGQYRADFMILSSGSNGYNQNTPPASVASFLGPQALVGRLDAISTSYYIGYNYYSTYNPQSCANLCLAVNANRRANAGTSGTYTPCNYFNTFNATSNGVFQAMYCLLYNDDAVATSATKQTLTVTSGSTSTTYAASYSYGYQLYPQDSGSASTSWTAAPQGTAASCSALNTANGTTRVDYNNQAYTLACGYDVQYSQDIGNTTSTDFYSCMNLCDNFAGCNAFAYNWGTCWFKNMTGSTRVPLTNSYGTDFAFMPGKGYNGFDAGKTPATVTYTTKTTTWTGSSTTTITSFNGNTAWVLVETPAPVNTATTTAATTTVTVTLDSGTATAVSYKTATNTNSKTVTITTIYPTPSCNLAAAVSYALYTNPVTGGQNTYGYPAYQPTTLKTIKPVATGTANYIGEYNGGSDTAISVYGNTVNPQNVVITNTFYIYAGRGSGYYTIASVYADDVMFVWGGSTAISGWNRTNAAILGGWAYTGFTQTPLSVQYFLVQGQYFPIRVNFANGGGAGELDFVVQAPDNSVMMANTQGANSGSIVPQINAVPCGTSWAAFPTFGKET